jgi:deoxycytidine triphosphate deaminase
MKNLVTNENAFGRYVRENLIGKEDQKPFKSISDLAHKLQMSRQYLHLLLNGDQAISPAQATQLGKITAQDPSLYLKLSRKDYSEDFLYPADAQDLVSDVKRSGSRYLVDFEIKRACEVGLLKIDPFEENCVQSVSIDLRIGEKITIHSQTKKQTLSLKENKYYFLQPNEIADVETLEYIGMPSCMLGILGSMTPLCANHIQLLYGAFCDPGYENTFMLSVKNLGFSAYKLASGAPFVTMGIVFLPALSVVSSSGKNAYQQVTDNTDKLNSYIVTSNDNNTQSQGTLSIENIYERLESDYHFQVSDIKKIFKILGFNEHENQNFTGTNILRELKQHSEFSTSQILDIIDAIMGSN